MLCKEQCYDFNALRPLQTEQQSAMIKKIFGKVGANCFITAPFWCDYGYNIEAGDNFYANHNLVILDCAKVTFGNNVFIAPDCGFYTAGHPVDAASRNEGWEYAYPINVGNDVWIGGGVKVMPGVTIGNNAVSYTHLGLYDQILTMSRQWNKYASDAGLKVNYYETAGNHDFIFWDKCIHETVNIIKEQSYRMEDIYGNSNEY